MEDSNWRSQLQSDSRQRIVNQLVEIIKKLLQFSGPEELQLLEKVTMRFEENIYAEATSQSDYLRKISLKMLMLETKCQYPLASISSGNLLQQIIAQQSDLSAQSGHSNGGDWRSQMQAGCRQRIVNTVTEALKRHLPVSGQEGLQELKIIAMRFEEKNYSAAWSQSDYLRKISLKILTMESKSSQNPLPNPLESNSALNNNRLPDPEATQSGHSNGGDWKEEVYQKIKTMKRTYLPELNQMHQELVTKLHQFDYLPQQPKSDEVDKLKILKTMLERIVSFLLASRTDILPGHKEKLGLYEKQIIHFLTTARTRPINKFPDPAESKPMVPQVESLNRSAPERRPRLWA